MKQDRFCSFRVLILGIFIFSFLSYPAFALRNAKVGEPALDFALKDIKGNEIKLSDYIDKNVVGVSFWNLSTDNSEKELKILNKLYKWYNKENGFEVFGIYCPVEEVDVSEEEIGKINKFVEEKKISFPILLDHKQTVYKSYGVIAFPAFFIVNKEGKINYLMPLWSKLQGEDNTKDNVKKALGLKVAKIRKSKQRLMVKKRYKPKKAAAMNMNMAEKFLKEGNIEKAIPKLKQAAEEDPKYVKPHSILASIYAKEGKLEDALIEYTTAIDINPKETQPRLDYGFFNLENGMVDEALEEFKKVLEIDPKSGDAHYGLGIIHRKKEQKEKAKAEFEKVINIFEAVGGDLFSGMRRKREVHPNLANAYNDLGEILLEEGKKEEAVTKLKKASEEYQRIIEKLLKYAK